jgi:hypothetical protein
LVDEQRTAASIEVHADHSRVSGEFAAARGFTQENSLQPSFSCLLIVV